MQNKFLAAATAATATFLIIEIAATVLFLSALLLLRAGEALLEGWGLIAGGWADGHIAGTLIVAAVPTVAASAAIAVWFFRRAYAAEYKYSVAKAG